MDIYRDKIRIVLLDGETITLDKWQEIYGIEGTKIGEHFSYMEYRFRQDIEEYGELIVNERLIRLLDIYRNLLGEPVRISSFNRSEEKQAELRRRGYKAATYSPHVAKMAADIDTVSKEETLRNVDVLRQASRISGVKCRIGFKSYFSLGQTFIHVDVCPEYYGISGVYHKEFHPKVWEKQIEW